MPLRLKPLRLRNRCATVYTTEHQPTMLPTPMALPLAIGQPGAIHSTPDGRAWYGHGDRVNPDTGMLQEAQFTLAGTPRQGDDLWIDGNAITIPLAQPQPAAQPADWPTLEDLDRGIAECRAALAGAPRYRAATAKAQASLTIWRAQKALELARIVVAYAEAAAEREQQEAIQRSKDWLAANGRRNQSDLSDLSWDEHPALTPAQRNPGLR